MTKKLMLATAVLALSSAMSFADTYSITVTNTLSEELLAPIIVTDAANDAVFFTGNYVTAEAEEQILTGDPSQVVMALGEGNAAVGHGNDGPPGVLLAAGDSVTFEFETDATALRILAMVAPTMVPDNYVTNVVDIHASDEVTVMLHRFDIGHDEMSMDNMMVMSDGGATVVITRQ
jgi:hypothetical protein